MEPFKTLDAIAAPIDTPNVDTDQIVPARFLWRKRGDGWSGQLFHDLRFDDNETPRPDFVLNRPAYEGARILVAGRNFGCGSSREHAVWCLLDSGIRVVIASSFGDIFHNNSYQNGLLPVTLSEDDVQALIARLVARPGAHLAADLEHQTVTAADGEVYEFAIEPFRKECLLAGADDIGYTLRLDKDIDSFERNYAARTPWY